MAITKPKTALVYNPARRLSIGGSKVNPQRRKKRARRRNPVRAVARKANPSIFTRRRNPASASGLLVAAVMAGIGVSLFDAITTRVVPQNSSLIRAGVKLGGAWLFQSNLGSKVPLLGKYRNDIALVLAVSGVVDLMKLYVLPLVSQTVSNFGLIAVPAAAPVTDGTTAGIYGNAYPLEYQNFS